MPYYAHGTLIRRLRRMIAKLHGKYNQEHLSEDTAMLERPVCVNTISKAERANEELQGLDKDSIEPLALALSHRLKVLKAAHPDHPFLQPLSEPEIGYILDRLMTEADPVLALEHLLMNHESRFLVDSYSISLTVTPAPGGVEPITYAGRPEPEPFHYNEVASVKYGLKFSRNNLRHDPGFELGYGTALGRLTLEKPTDRSPLEDRSYAQHRTRVSFRPDPLKTARSKKDGQEVMATHRLEAKVFGGYGPNNEGAHFKLAQPAVYRSVKITLDLTAYEEADFAHPPELILVPVLKSRPDFDCCDIARKKQGLPIEPTERFGLLYKWTFRDISDVMVGVHWETKKA